MLVKMHMRMDVDIMSDDIIVESVAQSGLTNTEFFHPEQGIMKHL